MSQQQGQESLPDAAEANDDQATGQVDIRFMRRHSQSSEK
jgi:hypothetical protein